MVKSICRAGLLGALVLGGVAFVAVTAVTAAEPRFHGPPAWLVGGIYGLAGAGLGFVLGVMGALLAKAFHRRNG